jgi:4-hydroxy-tetrahydrodipicolinate reductase
MNINERLAGLLSKFDNYSASIYETHHIHKLDKPSGTAISLAKGIIENNPKYVKAELNPISDIRNLEIFSFRDGEIIGDHKVIWESEVDKITIEHSAKNRNGLAIGAIIAAEYLDNKIGVYTIKDLLNL